MLVFCFQHASTNARRASLFPMFFHGIHPKSVNNHLPKNVNDHLPSASEPSVATFRIRDPDADASKMRPYLSPHTKKPPPTRR